MSLYLCKEEDCAKKFNSKEKLIDHTLNKHNKMLENIPDPVETKKEPQDFYLCHELTCNKKFKTGQKLINHALVVHNIILEQLPDPIKITKDNKKQEKQKKNEHVKKELYEQKIKEIERKKELDAQAKSEAEEKYKQGQIEKYRLLEEEKIKHEQEKLKQLQDIKKVEDHWIELQTKIQSNCNQNSELCSICFENNCDTAVIPCGHKFFCYECIDNYHKKFVSKGCPMCRSQIKMLNKIFSA